MGNCSGMHHSLLHYEAAVKTPATGANALPAFRTNLVKSKDRRVLFGILKVRVKTARGKWITAEAFLDSGSDRSLVSEALARKAGWKSHNKCDVLVTGAGNKTHEERSGRVDIVLDTDEGDAEMDAWTLSEVTAPLGKADWPSIKKSFPHLSDLPLTANSGKP